MLSSYPTRIRKQNPLFKSLLSSEHYFQPEQKKKMPRNNSSKKNPSNSATTTNPSSPLDLVSFSSKELVRIDRLFYSYANKSSGLIEPEGIESLCSDLEMDHTHVRILMLAWRMQAQKQGYFTLDEWRRGLQALKADTIFKLKKALPNLEKEVREPATDFDDFNTYAFQYCLTEEKQKTVDIESVCVLLDLVLGHKFGSQVDYLVQYLKMQTDYKVLNLDQWKGFYRFCTEISFPDLSNYDPDLAWPSILDDFFDWMKAKKG